MAPGILVDEHGRLRDDFSQSFGHILRNEIIWKALAKVQGLVLQGKSDEFDPVRWRVKIIAIFRNS